MTVRDAYEDTLRFHSTIKFIGVFNPATEEVIPEFADEYLETNADMEITDYQFSDQHECLIVFTE
jgi:hypothetical protein